MNRRSLVPPAALVGLLLLASPGWAPPPSRPPPPPPPPPRPPANSGRPSITTPVRPPGTSPRPPVVAPPGFAASLEAARRRSAAEAATLLRQQSAASLGRAQRAALLNLIAHDMLRHQQAASLGDLRRLRGDWVAIGPGAGLDPVVAMQLEAAESAAERLLLAEVLQQVRAGAFADALARSAELASPRHLPAAAGRALADLRAALARIVPFAQAQSAILKNQPQSAVARPLSDLPADQLPPTINQSSLVWLSLTQVQEQLDRPENTKALAPALEYLERFYDPSVAGKLRVELAARFYLGGQSDAAVALFDGAVDPAHLTAVLADLKAAVLGGGTITTPQIAAFVPAEPSAPPAPSGAILPPDRLARWKPPARQPGETTAQAALSDVRGELRALLDAEVKALGRTIGAAVERIDGALAGEAVPLNPFLKRVEVALGKPFATPAERQFAALVGGRGLTVAEVVGVLAAEADRPAAAARLLATVPAFTGPGAFAASVEVSGRAPRGFAPHPDAGFKLAAVVNRARLREAVGAVLNAQAGKVVSGRPASDFARGDLEAEIHDRLGRPERSPTADECVQGVLDVCRDWSDERARLADALRELNRTAADIKAGEYGDEDTELKELARLVAIRRVTVQTDKKRREAGLVIGCRVLGGYGVDAAPARDWLAAQAGGEDTPWRGDATAALEKIGAK